MNKIEMNVRVLDSKQFLVIDNIEFTNALLIEIAIDGQQLRTQKYFSDSLIVYPELIKSCDNSGKYLIFTTAIGVADAGGWEGVNVDIVSDLYIKWDFVIDDQQYSYCFDKADYLSEIEKLKKTINQQNNNLELEPLWVSYPESW